MVKSKVGLMADTVIRLDGVHSPGGRQQQQQRRQSPGWTSTSTFGCHWSSQTRALCLRLNFDVHIDKHEQQERPAVQSSPRQLASV
jgi:hypothetical protein